LWLYSVDRMRGLLGGALSEGGNLYAWMTQTLRLGPREEIERALAELAPDAHGLTVLPFLAGERSPGYHGDARATITGLSLSTRPIEILRAGLEAIAFRFALISDILETAIPPPREIIASGNAILSSPAWMQIMADTFARPVIASGEEEATSRGVALLAFEKLGLLTSLNDAPAALGRVYEPDPARHAIYQRARERQRVLYEQVVIQNS
jgi:gluconokinase